MKISIVTISYNQAQFLEECILSVLNQDYDDIEYIVVDPGSTDGSRDIVEKYRNRITHIIYEKDEGAADGLNKGFSVATGDVFSYLNSDDVLLENAISNAVDSINECNNFDVYHGDAIFINQNGDHLRCCYTDNFSLNRLVYGASIIIQPATFIKKEAFLSVGGFNKQNKVNWDTELLFDIAMNNGAFKKIKGFYAGYRLYPGTVTCSEKSKHLRQESFKRFFKNLKGREPKPIDLFVKKYYQFQKHLTHPRALLERVFKGSVIRNSEK